MVIGERNKIALPVMVDSAQSADCCISIGRANETSAQTSSDDPDGPFPGLGW
jgi:hypothetical protein